MLAHPRAPRDGSPQSAAARASTSVSPTTLNRFRVTCAYETAFEAHAQTQLVRLAVVLEADGLVGDDPGARSRGVGRQAKGDDGAGAPGPPAGAAAGRVARRLGRVCGRIRAEERLRVLVHDAVSSFHLHARTIGCAAPGSKTSLLLFFIYYWVGSFSRSSGAVVRSAGHDGGRHRRIIVGIARRGGGAARSWRASRPSGGGRRTRRRGRARRSRRRDRRRWR